MVNLLLTIILAILLSLNTIVFAKSYKKTLCSSDLFTCQVIKKHESWSSLFPDPDKRFKVMKINRMNTDLYPGLKIAIPKDDSTNILDLAPFAKKIDPPGQKIIKISLDNLAFGAYDPEGDLQYWGPISGGQGYCPDIHRGCHTSTGSFTIYQKGGSDCKSTRYPVGRGGAPMPYCMFFHGNFALHGSPNVPGYNASHGCVRMFTKDAKWLNQEFSVGSRVKVIIY